MHLFHRALLVAAIVLLGGTNSASTAINVKMSDLMPSNPSRRANSLIESANRGVATRSLRKKNKVLNDDDYASKLEDRGYLTKWFGFKIDLKTISDENLAKIMSRNEAELKAFWTSTGHGTI